MVRKETTVTGNKVTVSLPSFESASPVLGWWGLFLPFEMIIAYETVRMRSQRKK